MRAGQHCVVLAKNPSGPMSFNQKANFYFALSKVFKSIQQAPKNNP